MNVNSCLLACIILATVISCAPQRKLAPPFTRSPAQCIEDLATQNIAFTIIPEDQQKHCVIQNQIQLDRSLFEYTGTGSVKGQCEFISALARWEQEVVAPAAAKHLGTPVIKIRELSNFSCRNIARTEFRSQHSYGNAIDVSGFYLADGRYIDVEGAWGSDTDADDFLHAVRHGSCKIFATTLSPDYNWDHRNHFHFDVGGYLSCD